MTGQGAVQANIVQLLKGILALGRRVVSIGAAWTWTNQHTLRSHYISKEGCEQTTYGEPSLQRAL